MQRDVGSMFPYKFDTIRLKKKMISEIMFINVKDYQH